MILNILIYIFVFALGLCIGSFLNCVIYRLEQEKSLKGRSFCPHCKHKLSWQDLFPIFSFLFLKGKCRFCKKNISWQYPLVELATGILFVLVFNHNVQHSALMQSFGGYSQALFLFLQFLDLIFLFYITSVLIVIFIYDLKHYLIPDKILFPAIIITLILVLQFLFINQISIFVSSILAAIIASGFFLAIFLLSKGRAMGFGDVKLAILMGLLLGFPNILVGLFLAFFFGAIIGLTLIVFPFGSAQGRQRKTLKSEIPFGPFLITGTFIALIWGAQLVNWYLHLFLI